MQLTSYYSTGAVRLTKADDKSAEKTEKTTSKLKVGKEKPPGKSISTRSGKGSWIMVGKYSNVPI